MSGCFGKHANKSTPILPPQKMTALSFIFCMTPSGYSWMRSWCCFLSRQNACSLSVLTQPPVLNQFVFCLINFPQCQKSTSWTWKFHPENSKSYYFTPRKGRKTSLSSPRKGTRPPLSIFLSIPLHRQNPVIYIFSLYLLISSMYMSSPQRRTAGRRQLPEALFHCQPILMTFGAKRNVSLLTSRLRENTEQIQLEDGSERNRR